MNLFKEYLILRKETVAEFSRRAKLSRPTIYRLLHGKPVKPHIAKKIEYITKYAVPAISIPQRF